MGAVGDIEQEIEKLINSGRSMRDGHEQFMASLDVGDFEIIMNTYERWYTQAHAIVQHIIPERLIDFTTPYDTGVYAIKSYLHSHDDMTFGLGRLSPDEIFRHNLTSQISILHAAQTMATSKLRDIHGFIQAQILDTNIDSARELLKNKHLRSAGIVCGVVLEAHLKAVMARHDVKTRKKKLTLAVLNDALKDEEVYDVPRWRSIQHLTDLRNLCAHDGDREPTKNDVQDLISGTEKIIKEVF